VLRGEGHTVGDFAEGGICSYIHESLPLEEKEHHVDEMSSDSPSDSEREHETPKEANWQCKRADYTSNFRETKSKFMKIHH